MAGEELNAALGGGDPMAPENLGESLAAGPVTGDPWGYRPPDPWDDEALPPAPDPLGYDAAPPPEPPPPPTAQEMAIAQGQPPPPGVVFNDVGAGGAMGAQPAGGEFLASMEGLPTGVENLQASGLMDMPRGGFGGGAADSLVRRTQAAERQAQGQLSDAEVMRDQAYQDLYAAKEQETEVAMEREARIAEMQAEKLQELNANRAEQQRIWEEKMAAEEQTIGEVKAAQKRYTEFQVGPGEKTVGQRVMASLAIAFSAFGAAVQRSQGIPAQNLASDIIQQQLDNEMRIQEMELNKLGKDVDFAQNVHALTRQFYSDEVSQNLAARGSLIELYAAQAESILASTKSEETRAAAQIWKTDLETKRKENDFAWARQRAEQAQKDTQQALNTQAQARAAAARQRQAQIQEMKKLKFGALQQDTETQRQLMVTAAKEQAKILEKLGGKPLEPKEAFAQASSANDVANQLGKFDKNLTGIGMFAGKIPAFFLGDQGIQNREAAKQLFTAYRALVTGQGAGPGELALLKKATAILDGEGTEAEARAFIETVATNMVDRAAMIVRRNPDSINDLNLNALEMVARSNKLDPGLQGQVMQRMQQLSSRGAQ